MTDSIQEKELSTKIMQINQSMIEDGEDVFFNEFQKEILEINSYIENTEILNVDTFELRRRVIEADSHFPENLTQSEKVKGDLLKEWNEEWEKWKETNKNEKKGLFAAKNGVDTRTGEGIRKRQKLMLPTNAVVPMNPLIFPIYSYVINELTKVTGMVGRIKQWIILIIPKKEEENNFGVEVQESCLDSLSDIEESSASFMSVIQKYFTDRGSLASNIYKNAGIYDYYETLYALDEFIIINFKMVLLRIRNTMSLSYDAIMKNIDWLHMPRMESDVKHIYI